MSKEFQWTDALVLEFTEDLAAATFCGRKLNLNEFKESKQPKPEWEIIQVSCLECGIYSLDGYKMKANDKIHSVRRRSDDSTWVTGDRFRVDAGCDLTIKEFKVSDEGMEVWSKEYGYWLLNTIRPVPLFITEDLKEIYVHDKIWALRKDDWFIDGASFITTAASASIGEDKNKNNYWYFSSKEAAEQYRLNNKPCLSLAEALACDKGSNSCDFINKVTTLVKSKIKP